MTSGIRPPLGIPPGYAATPGRFSSVDQAQALLGDRVRGAVTALGLHPDVPVERQRETIQATVALAKEVWAEGYEPVMLGDPRHATLDDAPIVRAGFEALVAKHGIAALADIDKALKNGTLRCFPGYTEEASDHWRALHLELVAAYPKAFAARPGAVGKERRLDQSFMSHPLSMAKAAKGLRDFEDRLKEVSEGFGHWVFAGAGSGTSEQLAAVYERPIADGGAGLVHVDARIGTHTPSAEATARAQALVVAHNEETGDNIKLDGDSAGKAAFAEMIEREKGRSGRLMRIVLHADDRTHNLFGVRGACQLGVRIISAKVIAPHLSYAQVNRNARFITSTFDPDPARTG
jgi:hypothetical protein